VPRESVIELLVQGLIADLERAGRLAAGTAHEAESASVPGA
jgi:hypothetical protein